MVGGVEGGGEDGRVDEGLDVFDAAAAGSRQDLDAATERASCRIGEGIGEANNDSTTT